MLSLLKPKVLHFKFLPRCWHSMNSQTIESALSNTNAKSSISFHNQFGNSVKLLSTIQFIDSSKLRERKLLENVKYLQQRKQGYAMRLELSEYGLVWKRPEYVPSWKPEKSGDLIPFEELDKKKTIVAFLPVEEQLLKADKRTQSLLSLEFSSSEEILKMAKYRMKRRIQQHQFDENSLELKIALMTVDIRFLQNVLENSTKKLTRTRVRLQETIDRRKRKLKSLRRYDYKKFEWLLEELQLIYRPFPRYQRWITRKGSLRKLVHLHCQRLKNEKLEKYRLELETLKKPFLEEKRQTLMWIAETERKLGLPVSVQVPEDEPPTKQLQD